MFPYDEYSWTFSQHVGKINDINVLFALLRAADIFRHDKDKDTRINSYLNEIGIIPKNLRADSKKSDIWRDYQQLLPELGLMGSSKYTKYPTLTNLGLLLLDNKVDFESLATNQSLRYQYPNGFKLQLPKGVKSENRAFLDDSNDILIKPAVLILRVLLEVLKDDTLKTKSLNAIEVVNALMPLKKNSDWSIALDILRDIRDKNSLNIPKLKMRKRHVEEWFRFLSYGSIFELTDGRISLSDNFSSEQLESICEDNESINSFWITDNFEDKNVLHSSWFEYYGNFNPNIFWLNSNEKESNSKKPYKSINEKKANINLRNINGYEKQFNSQYNSTNRTNHHKYRESSLLHDKIIQEMKAHIENMGFKAFEDPNSIDLLASNSETGKHILFEVKTIGAEDFWNRVRLGVGQVLEYRYRYKSEFNHIPETYLLINGNFDPPIWFNEYFKNELRIGLIQRKSENKFITTCDPFSNEKFFTM